MTEPTFHDWTDHATPADDVPAQVLADLFGFPIQTGAWPASETHFPGPDALMTHYLDGMYQAQMHGDQMEYDRQSRLRSARQAELVRRDVEQRG